MAVKNKYAIPLSVNQDCIHVIDGTARGLDVCFIEFSMERHGHFDVCRWIRSGDLGETLCVENEQAGTLAGFMGDQRRQHDT